MHKIANPINLKFFPKKKKKKRKITAPTVLLHFFSALGIKRNYMKKKKKR